MDPDYVLGLSLAREVLGWAIVGRAESGVWNLCDGGVRVYTDGRDPKTVVPLADERRVARRARRRRDRYIGRRKALFRELVRIGLMPPDVESRKSLQSIDPYRVRMLALDEMVPLHSLGRAIFHLNQRRGFKQSRKRDRYREDADLGVVLAGLDQLDNLMGAAAARTYGEYLACRHALAPQDYRAAKRWTRVRGSHEPRYAFFPGRHHIKYEFDAIWRFQQVYYPEVLTDDAYHRLVRIIFFQRELRNRPIGRCTFNDEPRIPKAHPLFQRMKLFKTINELVIEQVGQRPRALTLEERNKVLRALRSPSETKCNITLSQVRKAAGLPRDSHFRGEKGKGGRLIGDEVEAAMVSAYGPEWRDLSTGEQWQIIDCLINAQDEQALCSLLESQFGIGADWAEALIQAKLPTGFGRIGQTAAQTILAELEAEVITEREAVRRSGMGSGDHRTAGPYEKLPYYGEILARDIPCGTQDPPDHPQYRFGKVANATLHIALGQLRRVINAILAKYGPPREIVIELPHELRTSGGEQNETAAKVKRSRDAAIRRASELENRGIPNTGANRAMLQAWEELHPEPAQRACIYTGKPISFVDLFSGAVVLDHILPIGSTLDDTHANKIVTSREAKVEKGQRTPFDAFGHTPNWPAILARVQNLPASKRWRFAPDAIVCFEQDGGFIARQLNDTQYLPRLVKAYLAALYPEAADNSPHVRVIRGRFVEMLRRSWDLNGLLPDQAYVQTAKRRCRTDYRHHLIDAFVAATINLPLMQSIASAAERNSELGHPKVLNNIPVPWNGFREELKALLDRTIVSHKPDHGSLANAMDRANGRDRTAGRLHNDTAYGFTGQKNANDIELVVRRVPLLSLDSSEKIASVRDGHLRQELLRAIQGTSGKATKAALTRFAEEHPVYRDIRRVRVLEAARTIKIFDREGRAYKGYKGNSIHHIDIWRLPDGEWISKWQDEHGNTISSAIQMFDAHQAGNDRPERRPHPAAKKILRLQQNDMVALDHPLYGECICRVVKLREAGQVTLAPHMEAGDLSRRNKRTEDPFKFYSPTAAGLKKARARRIRIDELGRVWDPGPRD